MLGFSIRAYALPEDNWIESLSLVRPWDRESLVHLGTGLRTPFPREDAHLGIYRLFRQGGYPTEMVTSFAYLEHCIDNYVPETWKPVHKYPAWSAMEPSALVLIEEWDQS